MNHKEAFFKKAQHNQEEVVSIEQKTKLDIKSFQDSMAALARQIETWLQGSGVEVEIFEKPIHDETLSFSTAAEVRSLSRYMITTLKLKNGNKHADLSPVGVYGGGACGWANLLLSNLSYSSSHPQPKFLLKFDKSAGSWLIGPERTTNSESVQRVTLTEEIFFQAIASLA